MAAITSIAVQGPPILLGNAAGHAVIMEAWRIPASTAGDTQTLVSPNIATIIAVLGNVQHAAPANSENGASIDVITSDTVAADNFTWVLIIGFARRVHSGGLA